MIQLENSLQSELAHSGEIFQRTQMGKLNELLRQNRVKVLMPLKNSPKSLRKSAQVVVDHVIPKRTWATGAQNNADLSLQETHREFYLFAFMLHFP